jgi:hypothetical protein
MVLVRGHLTRPDTDVGLPGSSIEKLSHFADRGFQ